MALRDQRQPGTCRASASSVSAVGQSRAVLDRAEVAAVAGAQPVAELVDGPQVDARGIEREAVPVVDAGVLAEAVQEDDGGPRLGGGPVAVVGPALWVIDERHAHDCSRWCAARARPAQPRFARAASFEF